MTREHTAPEKKSTDWRLTAATVVLLALLMLWVKPYHWPNTNHTQEIPPILALGDPGLYENDFAVRSFLKPSPRAAYQHLMAFAMSAGLALSLAYLAAQIATLVAVGVVLNRITGWIVQDREPVLHVVCAVTLTLWVVASNHHGWNLPIVDGSNAVPSTFAMGFALWGWFRALQRHWGSAYMLWGIATVLQFLVGLMPGLILAPVAAGDALAGDRRARIRIAAGAAAWVACLAAVSLPILLADRGGAPMPAEELIRVYGHVRVPHHWIPSTAGAWHWVNQSFLATAAVVLALRIRADDRARRLRAFALTSVIAAAILLAINYAFVELWASAIVAKLQMQRAMPFARFAVIVVLAWYFCSTMREGRYFAAVALMLAPIGRADGVALLLFAAAEAMHVSSAQRASSKARQMSATLLSLSLVVTAISIPRPERYPIAPAALLLAGTALLAGFAIVGRRLRHTQLRTVVVVASFAAVVGTGVIMVYPRQLARLGFGVLTTMAPKANDHSEFDRDLRVLARIIETRVPKEEILLGPPGWVEPLPLLSRRGVVFSWKNVPYSDAGIREWGTRLEDIVGRRVHRKLTQAELSALWAARSEGDLDELATRYRAAFIVSRHEWHRWPRARLVGTAGAWNLWRAAWTDSAPVPERDAGRAFPPSSGAGN